MLRGPGRPAAARPQRPGGRRRRRPGFDARRDARSRRYEYRVLPGPPSALRARPGAPPPRRRSTRTPWPTPPRRVVGRHDFRAFTPTRTEHVFFDRTVTVCDVVARGDELVLTVEADAFLRHMVRVLAGTILLVGRGAWPASRLDAAAARGAARGAPGPTAPAHALTLVGRRLRSMRRPPPTTRDRVDPHPRHQRRRRALARPAGAEAGAGALRAGQRDRARLQPQRHRARHHHPPRRCTWRRCGWPTAPRPSPPTARPVDCVRFATLGLLDDAPRRHRQRHQPGAEPGRRRDLLGHRRGRPGGAAARLAGHRGVGAGDRPDRRPVGRHRLRLPRRRRLRRPAGAGRLPRGLPAPGAAERERPRAAARADRRRPRQPAGAPHLQRRADAGVHRGQPPPLHDLRRQREPPARGGDRLRRDRGGRDRGHPDALRPHRHRRHGPPGAAVARRPAGGGPRR